MKTLSHLGIAMPALGLGTWQLAGTVCERMVRAALDMGYRHIDTAQVYGNEEEVGTALARSGVAREEVFLTTKVWMEKLEYDDVLASTEESLRRLRTDYVDLLLIHWPNPQVPLARTLEAMMELRERGRARAIGVSNFPTALVRQAVEEVGAPIFSNQVECHALLSQQRLLDFQRPRGIILTAYSPLAHGRLPAHSTLQAVGRRHGKSAAQVALRWLIEQEGMAAIPRSANVARAKANLEIFDFELSAEDKAAINALQGNIRTIDPTWAPEWDK